MNVPSTPSAPPPAISPLEAARNLAPLIRASADETEATRELPRLLFEALADAGLFLMAVPREVGGREIDLPEHVLAVEEIGKADASTAWAVNQGATFGSYSAYMQPDAVRDIWIDTPRGVVSNSPAPTAQAVVVPGGFRVTGRQGFSTGCRHASWVAAHAQIIENGEVRQRNGKPETRYCIVPKVEAEIIDTWRTRGMRGTGTHHFEVKDVFVPEERTVFTANAQRVSGGARYRIPQTLCFAAGDGAIALAVARSCLDAFFELAGSKAPRHLQGLLRDQAISQLTVGQAEAALRSGRAFLMEAVADLWNEATETGAVSIERRISMRLAGTHAIRLAAKIVESIYTASGGNAIFEGHPIQRHFQDIHVITQHLQGRLAYYELVGKHQLGLPIDETRL
jgi:indole-3-acetate monooxygenase